MENNLRNIPKLDEFLRDSKILQYKNLISQNRITQTIREIIDETRKKILSGAEKNVSRIRLYERILEKSINKLNIYERESLKKVINATGIVIHTNLGRSPLSQEASQKAMEIASGYNNLEYSVLEGKRRNRLNYIEKMIVDLTGVEAAIVVNNNAAAVYLALNTLCQNKEVLLSRGEIVEIGDSFRISEIIETSGCRIKEVGTTNKTKLDDYEKNINESTAILLKVHTSNFKIIGFTSEASSLELVELGKKNNIPVLEDMGSGILFDLSKYGFKYERQVKDAVKDGVDIITFSGDKMLGGPQAGIIAGKKKYIDPMRKNQMLRCLRADKMCLASLEATLSHYFNKETMEKIPTLQYIFISEEKILEKSNTLKAMLNDVCTHLKIEIKAHISQFGGGSLPSETINGYGLFITSSIYSANYIEQYLRNQEVPIISTLQDDEIILDLRTVPEEEFDYIINIFKNLESSQKI